ncbi:hypothetical protein L6164_017473 [Bauhinia variegata]|uniref:Uncharacterized protein n=1 Tax=Bauhinia variegata TaxID=167791 RepID=A0ACB9N9B4_BAUVA|nr:hypothetical protein L6164_017473 [Bauhinia variegata]
MRIDKKLSVEVEDEMSAIASDIANIKKADFFKKLGDPVSLLLPPGTVNAAVKTPVAMSVETTIQELAVPFIQDSAFFCNSACSFMNNSSGVLPSEFFISLSDGSIIFFTSYKFKKMYACDIVYV